ncbi:MAG TPA: DUF2877 domain-containing protein [Jatrophihabitantaceae bacterium]|jgi:hypothetical protein|nr:DUF2877 domain-containing protein [Jatrophihabitantaceae bacterium]
MRIPAASCTRVHRLVTGPRQPVAWLGTCGSALYLRTRCDSVVAVVTRDAQWLPCALVVPRRASELPLDSLVDDFSTPAMLGDGELRWTHAGDGGRHAVSVVCSGWWSPPELPTGSPVLGALARVTAAASSRDIGVQVEPGTVPVVAELLGRGPGLTPSGDDVLAGYLLAARAFGTADTRLAIEVSNLAPDRTTALSAQLLRHAIEGDCVPAFGRLVTACITGAGIESAIGDVLRIGATSGAALMTGVLIAAGTLHHRHAGAAA